MRSQMTTKCKEKLPVEITPVEKTEFLDKLSKLVLELQKTQEEKKSVSAEFSAAIKTINSEVLEISQTIQIGTINKEVDCEWIYDDPKPGMKTLYRFDLGQSVKTIPMTPEDFQTTMQFPEE